MSRALLRMRLLELPFSLDSTSSLSWQCEDATTTRKHTSRTEAGCTDLRLHFTSSQSIAALHAVLL